MSMTVISFCSLEIKDKTLTDDETKGLVDLLNANGASDVHPYGDEFAWQLSGNHAVDYDMMEKVKAFLKEIKAEHFEINSTEFVGGEGGYRFDSDEEN